MCVGTDPAVWEMHPLLSFATKVDEQTGEIKSGTKTAFFKGLHFFLIPSTKSSEIHCIIRGSLPKYYNNGRDNAYDFDTTMLRETIQDIAKRFKIDISKAVVQHFEFGLNIETEEKPKKIIRGLRAFQSDIFTSLKVDEVFNGRQIQKQEYQYKVYDKALQLRKKNKNILRIELAVKSRKKAKKYGIEVLQDLTEIENLERMKPDLLKVWEEGIFHDRGIKWREMSTPQQKKWLFYLDATNWESFNRQQRTRAKKNFLQLKAKFSTSITQEKTTALLRKKLEVLTAVNDNALRNLFEGYDSGKTLRFTDLDKGVNSYHFEPLINRPSIAENNVKARRPKCRICNTDISHKKETAVFCSKKCSNAYQGKKRRKKTRQRITVEKKELNRILTELSGKKLRLIITRKEKGNIITKSFVQSRVYFEPDEIKAIQKVEVLGTEKVVFTSYRSRKLIKRIVDINGEKPRETKLKTYKPNTLKLNLSELLPTIDERRKAAGAKPIGSMRALARELENQWPDRYEAKYINNRLHRATKNGIREVPPTLVEDLLTVLEVEERELLCCSE